MRSLFEEDGLLMKFEEFQGTGEQGKYVAIMYLTHHGFLRIMDI